MSIAPLRHALCETKARMTKMILREEFPASREVPQQERLVLVVEDESDTQRFMTESLEHAGISCVAASSVGDALRALQAQSIDLTVLDWCLDKSGCEVLSVARELYPAMPVVAISGRPFEVRTDAVVNNADAFLSKPFSATVLVGQVKQLLERTRPAPAIVLPRKPEDILPLEEVQSIYIRHVVQLFGGNKSRAAEALGIHRHTVSTAFKDTSDVDRFVIP
jgi:DNA-binding NtrC family response regulator